MQGHVGSPCLFASLLLLPWIPLLPSMRKFKPHLTHASCRLDLGDLWVS